MRMVRGAVIGFDLFDVGIWCTAGGEGGEAGAGSTVGSGCVGGSPIDEYFQFRDLWAAGD